MSQQANSELCPVRFNYKRLHMSFIWKWLVHLHVLRFQFNFIDNLVKDIEDLNSVYLKPLMQSQ